MLEAVTATYGGGNVFIMDEALPLSEGQRVMITVLKAKPAVREREIDPSRYSGSAGPLFGSVEKTNEYIKGLRENDRS